MGVNIRSSRFYDLNSIGVILKQVVDMINLGNIGGPTGPASSTGPTGPTGTQTGVTGPTGFHREYRSNGRHWCRGCRYRCDRS